MSSAAREAYLETQLLTATPQLLRLKLIEGAIRFGQQTLQHWQAECDDQAFDAMLRCRGIVTELLVSVKSDGTEVSRRVTALYLFLFQTLTEAQLRRDEKKLREVIELLEIERETWQSVCEQMPEPPQPDENTPQPPSSEITASDAAAVLPDILPPTPGGSFSLDA